MEARLSLEELQKPFPAECLRTRPGGRSKELTYVETATVIRRLNRATGNDWTFVVDRIWVEDGKSMALVTLTIPGCGSRQHVGVQAQGSGAGEDAIAKGAVSDGLKKAATLFGVGLELYGQDIEGEMERNDAKDAFAIAAAKSFSNKVVDANGEYVPSALAMLFKKVTGLDSDTATAADFMKAADVDLPAYVQKLLDAKKDKPAAPAQSMTDTLAADADAGKPAPAASNYATMETQEGRR